jgi:hypothetical protein
MKKQGLLFLFILIALQVNAGKFDLWGINVSDPHPEISSCKVKELPDKTIFSEVKITAYSYTFATNKNEEGYSCFYGDEDACFTKAAEIITKKFGQPLNIYTYDEGNTMTTKPAFFRLWKYDKDDKHFVMLLFGSGEGMTFDVNHYVSERQSKAFILSTIRSFHFAIRPDLLFYLEK